MHDIAVHYERCSRNKLRFNLNLVYFYFYFIRFDLNLNVNLYFIRFDLNLRNVNLNLRHFILNLAYFNLNLASFNMNLSYFKLNLTYLNLNLTNFNLYLTHFNLNLKRCSMRGRPGVTAAGHWGPRSRLDWTEGNVSQHRDSVCHTLPLLGRIQLGPEERLACVGRLSDGFTLGGAGLPGPTLQPDLCSPSSKLEIGLHRPSQYLFGTCQPQLIVDSCIRAKS